jgi:hypothetical protein
MPHSPNHRAAAHYIRKFAKNMRREPTDAEAAMWGLLRDRRLAQFKFRRQVPFQNYILDFVCFEQRFVVEVDGSQIAGLAPYGYIVAMQAALQGAGKLPASLPAAMRVGQLIMRNYQPTR